MVIAKYDPNILHIRLTLTPDEYLKRRNEYFNASDEYTEKMKPIQSSIQTTETTTDSISPEGSLNAIDGCEEKMKLIQITETTTNSRAPDEYFKRRNESLKRRDEYKETMKLIQPNETTTNPRSPEEIGISDFLKGVLYIEDNTYEIVSTSSSWESCGIIQFSLHLTVDSNEVPRKDGKIEIGCGEIVVDFKSSDIE